MVVDWVDFLRCRDLGVGFPWRCVAGCPGSWVEGLMLWIQLKVAMFR